VVHCSQGAGTLLRGSSQSLGGAGRCLRHTAAGRESSERDFGEREAASAQKAVVEHAGSYSSVAVGESGWSRAKWSVGGGNDSCSC
jgi:hypothetical protein